MGRDDEVSIFSCDSPWSTILWVHCDLCDIVGLVASILYTTAIQEMNLFENVMNFHEPHIVVVCRTSFLMMNLQK